MYCIFIIESLTVVVHSVYNITSYLQCMIEKAHLVNDNDSK